MLIGAENVGRRSYHGEGRRGGVRAEEVEQRWRRRRQEKKWWGARIHSESGGGGGEYALGWLLGPSTRRTEVVT